MPDLKDVPFDVVEVAGFQALFTPGRIPRDQVPAGLYRYELRHGDDFGVPCTLEPAVKVNFCGSILCKHPFVFPENDPYLDISGSFHRLYGHRDTCAQYLKRPESKLFSIVTLICESGETCKFFASGIPQDCDELADSEQYCDFIEGVGGQRVSAEIRAYSYGEGESERADDDDLKYVAEHFEEMYQRDEINWLQDAALCFDVEQEQTAELEDDELEP